VENFVKQDYPNKELIIIFNSNEKDVPEIQEVSTGKNTVRILIAPQEMFLGACLNMGLISSKGVYCFKVDDDDIYGQNYVPDTMLHLYAMDCDIFGKPFKYCYFERDKQVYIQRTKLAELCTIPHNSLTYGKYSFHGATLGGRRAKLLTCLFPDYYIAGEDNGLQQAGGLREYRFVSLDLFNFIYYRGANINEHTWKVSTEQLKKNMYNAYVTQEDLIL
jgi:glycosyltransferase involved in cell wall biosynthesis